MNARLAARKKTREKRKDQVLHVIELKLDKSHFNKEQEQFLFRLFLEGKFVAQTEIGPEEEAAFKEQLEERDIL